MRKEQTIYSVLCDLLHPSTSATMEARLGNKADDILVSKAASSAIGRRREREKRMYAACTEFDLREGQQPLGRRDKVAGLPGRFRCYGYRHQEAGLYYATAVGIRARGSTQAGPLQSPAEMHNRAPI